MAPKRGALLGFAEIGVSLLEKVDLCVWGGSFEVSCVQASLSVMLRPLPVAS